MFYVVFVLVLAVLGTWNSGVFLEKLDGLSMVLKSVISLAVLGLVPALIIIAGGMFDAFISSRRMSR